MMIVEDGSSWWSCKRSGGDRERKVTLRYQSGIAFSVVGVVLLSHYSSLMQVAYAAVPGAR